MSRQVYRFGEYRLDPSTHELTSRGSRVALPPKSFECLAYLLEHRERTVGRDELISAVWGRTDVADTVVAQTLLRARRAVGDTGGEQAVVRTVPRFGYRWVAAVERVDAADAAAPAADAMPAPDSAAADAPPVAADDVPAATEPLHTHRVRLAAFAIAGLLFAALAFVAWRSRPAATPSTASGAATQAVARDVFLVLPVSLAETHTETAWIRLGVMDYIASRLREDAHLQVLPSDEVVALVKADVGDARASDGLHRLELSTGASYILAPRATQANGSWTFALDVYHGGELHSFQASAATPAQAAGLASQRFLESIGSRVGEPTESPAQVEWLRRIDAAVLAGSLDEARRLADSAPADLAGDARLSIRAGRIAFRAGRLDEAERTFRPLAADAAAPTDVRIAAHLGLGAIGNWRHDFEAAERDYAQALALLGEQGDPGLRGRARTGLGVSHMSRDRIDEALAEFGRARIDLERSGDPLGLADLDIDVGLAESGRAHHSDAVAAFDRALATFVRFGIRDKQALALLNKIDTQLSMLDIPAAMASGEQAWTLAGHLENRVLVEHIAIQRARTLLIAGHLQEAQKLIDRFDPAADPNRPDADPVFALLRANLLRQRGDYVRVAHDADAILDRVEKPADPTRRTNFSGAALELIESSLHAGDLPRASRLLARLEAANAAAPDRESDYVTAMAQAEVLAARNDPAAGERFAAAFALADRRGPAVFAAVATAYVLWLVEQRRLDEASAIVGRLAPYLDKDYGSARAAAALYAAAGDHGLAAAAEARVRTLAGERNPELPL
jgi:DNA-binding winged helix-turn-helix (wHTH) protein